MPERSRLLPLWIAALLWIAGCAAEPRQLAPLAPASVDALRKSVEYLASDALEGRGIGTAGLDEAATYIAGYFRGLGLVPLEGQGDYYQPFKFTTVSGPGARTTLRINGKDLAAGRDFQPYVFSAEAEFAGGVVFAGYGIAGARDGAGREYDDYAGVDVEGKVVLVMRFEPHDADGRSRIAPGDWSPHARLEHKARQAAQRGAAAMMVVHPVRYHGPERFTTLDRLVGQNVGIPVVQISIQAAEELLRAAGASDLGTFQARIDEQFRPFSMVLRRSRAEGRVELERKTYDLRNVAAALPGKWRPDRYIVVGAHYDHLGRGGFGSMARGSGEIHNGADDNASGTAALLEVARLLSEAGGLPKTVIFVAFSAEERGLVGSRWWVEHAPVPLERIDAMINMDMIGRVRNNVVLVGGGATAAAFEHILREAEERSPLQFRTAGASGIAPSDSTSFLVRRIPVLFFWTGMHADYHRPSDDADKINYEGLAQIVDVVGHVVQSISVRNDVRFAGSAAVAGMQATDVLRPGGGAASLGVVPDYGMDQAAGVKISGTVAGSPAERAGLEAGDVLVAWDGRPLQTIYDLTDYLRLSQPGQMVRLRYLRHGRQREAEVVLGTRDDGARVIDEAEDAEAAMEAVRP